MIGVDVSVGDPLARVDPRGGLRSCHRGDDRLAGRADRARDRRRRDARHQPAAEGHGRQEVAEPLDAPLDRRPGRRGDPARRAQLHVPRRPRQGRRPAGQLDAVKAQIAALPQPKAPVIDAGVVGDEAARATAVARCSAAGSPGTRSSATCPACCRRTSGSRPSRSPPRRGGQPRRRRRLRRRAAGGPGVAASDGSRRSTDSRTPSPMSPASSRDSRRSPRCSA